MPHDGVGEDGVQFEACAGAVFSGGEAAEAELADVVGGAAGEDYVLVVGLPLAAVVLAPKRDGGTGEGRAVVEADGAGDGRATQQADLRGGGSV